MNTNDINKFVNRECKAKDLFTIKEISKDLAYSFVKQYHYLGDAKFFCCKAYGLFTLQNNELVGCATFQIPQGTESLKGWFSLGNDTKNIFELGRLCMLPSLNGTNATSFMLGGAIKQLQKENNKVKDECRHLKKSMSDEDWVCRAIITLACAERHAGSIYQVCNFTYYGTTQTSSDFWREDGAINPRGTPSTWYGVYLPRARKYRYAYILDKTLVCNYAQISQYPKKEDILKPECCQGKRYVYDKRFNRYYTCPKCCGQLSRIYITSQDILNNTTDEIVDKAINESTFNAGISDGVTNNTKSSLW